MRHGKKYRASAELTTKAGQVRDLAEAVKLVKQTARAKFDETIVLSSHLGGRSPVTPISSCVAPSCCRTAPARACACSSSPRATSSARRRRPEPTTSGAEELVKKIQDGWLEVDAIVATPDMMGEVGKLGKILGPRGLMPNPKSGTVTFDVAKAINELKAGKIEFRVDKGANVHAPSARCRSARRSCSRRQTFLRELMRAKPAGAKGAPPRAGP